ncbi:hypothetical protein TNIN_216031 [Trichonephila inaurata madagascariensis]|uniref:Uncharacterized protein n=1 Tax=Trichonephila inaurata madagascariensis TaxID=2747483 RepID=A0A8X6MCH7_9ARAC|nr:hypothetical protein TNIN_216031 [Trichonephila inaurata madagascariensis]
METIRRCQQTCVDSLRQMPDHYPEEPFYTRALTELQEMEVTMALAVSDIDSFPHVQPLAALIMKKNPVKSPKKFINTPRGNNVNNPGKRKDISSFEYPPLRKTARKIVLNHPENEEINLSSNKYALSQDENDIQVLKSTKIIPRPKSETPIPSQKIRSIRALLKPNSPTSHAVSREKL